MRASKWMIMVMLLVMNMGCATAYNHNRVKKNMLNERIMTYGNQEMIARVARGADPEDVLKFSVVKDARGEAVGAMVSADLMGGTSFLSTFKEAPGSTSLAILADLVASGLTYAVIDNSSLGGGSKQSEYSAGGDVNEYNIGIQHSDGTQIKINTSESYGE